MSNLKHIFPFIISMVLVFSCKTQPDQSHSELASAHPNQDSKTALNALSRDLQRLTGRQSNIVEKMEGLFSSDSLTHGLALAGPLSEGDISDLPIHPRQVILDSKVIDILRQLRLVADSNELSKLEKDVLAAIDALRAEMTLVEDEIQTLENDIQNLGQITGEALREAFKTNMARKQLIDDSIQKISAGTDRLLKEIKSLENAVFSPQIQFKILDDSPLFSESDIGDIEVSNAQDCQYLNQGELSKYKEVDDMRFELQKVTINPRIRNQVRVVYELPDTGIKVEGPSSILFPNSNEAFWSIKPDSGEVILSRSRYEENIPKPVIADFQFKQTDYVVGNLKKGTTTGEIAPESFDIFESDRGAPRYLRKKTSKGILGFGKPQYDYCVYADLSLVIYNSGGKGGSCNYWGDCRKY
jgi:hypothetical protein